MIYPNGLDEEYSKLMLDLIHDLTGLSVSLYLNNKRKTIYSRKYWPEFCVEICNHIDKEVCGDLLSPEEGLHMCKAGLWCLIKPLKIDGQEIGYYSIGHRRISGKDKESLCKLGSLLEQSEKGCYGNKNFFIDLFNRVSIFNEQDFYDPSIEKVSLIERDIIKKFEDTHEFKVNASRLAHQFLLPIQSIVANAENLYFEIEKTNMKNEYKLMTSDILDEVTKLAYVANSIRSHLASGRLKSDYLFDKVEFIPIVLEVIKLFRREAETKRVLIKDPIIKDLPVPVIEASKPHLEIVFFNIYHNAVKYSYYSGNDSQRHIDTKIYQKKNYICFEISNYGVGILQNEIEKDLIYVEGYRGELARDKWRTGSGIGLSVVKRIVADHNGKIQITSENMGIGRDSDPHKTTIKIDLPIFHESRR